MNRYLGPLMNLPQVQQQQIRPLPQLMFPQMQPQQDPGMGMMSGGMGLLGMLGKQAPQGLLGGLGSYQLPAASYLGMGLKGPGGLLGGGV